MFDQSTLDGATKSSPRHFSIGRLLLEVRLDVSPARQFAVIGGSILLGLSISAAILVAVGVSPTSLWEEFVLDTVFDQQNLHSVWFLAGPLTFIGLAAAIAFRSGFWNLGLEGQMVWGGIAGTFVSLYHVGPEAVRLPIMLAAAALAGALWVMLPAFLKSRFAVNEIISTLLLNYIAMYFLIYLLYGPWLDPRDGFPHSPNYAPFERLPEWSGFSSVVPLAVGATLLIAWLVLVSRVGLYMRFINDNWLVSLVVGVPNGAGDFGGDRAFGRARRLRRRSYLDRNRRPPDLQLFSGLWLFRRADRISGPQQSVCRVRCVVARRDIIRRRSESSDLLPDSGINGAGDRGDHGV